MDRMEPGRASADYSLDDILNEYRGSPSRRADDFQFSPPEEPPAPRRRSSLPSEAEVRAYLASYVRGERVKDEPEDEVDPRFLMGEDRERRRGAIRYGGREIDNCADESYTPPRAEGFIPSNVRVDEEEESAERRPGLFRRMVDAHERRRAESARREEAAREEKRREAIPQPKELVLPGEEASEAAAADEPEAPKPLTAPAPAKAPEAAEPAAAPRQRRPAEASLLGIPTLEEPAAEPEEETPAAVKAEAAAAREEAPVEEAPAAREEAPAEEAPAAREEAPAEKPRFTPSWSRTAAAHREYASAFPDTSASPAVYADRSELEATPPTENGDGSIPLKEEGFPSFKEYLASIFTTILYGMRRGAASVLTVEEDEEELGPEAAPAEASRYYGLGVRSLRLRLRICGVLLLVLAWVSLGLPTPGQLGNIRVASLFCFALQGAVMLLSLDVLTGGVLNAFRRRFGADSLAVLACLLTGADALLVGLTEFASPHLPLCLLSSLSLTGVLLSSLTSSRGLRKALRVPAIARRAYTVTGETSLKGRGTTLLKSVRPHTGFVRRAEEAPPDEITFQKLGWPILILALLLTLVTAAVTGNIKDFFYIFSALLCPAVPFAALLCFSLPFFTGSFRIFPSGAAIAGWSGLCDIGRSRNLIVTDRDLFPEGTVEIDQIRIFADIQPEKVISYAGSMLTACGSSVSACFGELMEKNNCPMRSIENFEYLPGGGMMGVIDSSVVLCGSSELMQLMNVRIPFRLVTRTSILLAVDGVLYGIFNMKYSADPQVRKALVNLIRSNRHPIFAIRDFNVTPSMLHDCFDVATDGYDFPPYVERFAISSAAPGEGSKVSAVVCRDGLGPLTHMADTGRSMYVAVRTNLYLTLLGAVLGMFVSFLRMLMLGGAGLGFLFVFMLLWSLPVLLIGTLLNLQ
ncbi:MAG: hypothetical protein K6G17_00840 [Oscillospiraceae bacterium]|nr:hypothetical protein [Oscillospiraceae bacterium]